MMREQNVFHCSSNLFYSCFHPCYESNSCFMSNCKEIYLTSNDTTNQTIKKEISVGRNLENLEDQVLSYEDSLGI